MIGIFNDNYPPVMDGVAMTARNYAYWLHKKGEEVCVVTPYAPEMPKDDEFPLYRYTSFPIPMRPPYRFGLPHIDLQFRHKLNAIKFDLVHAHCPFTSGYLAYNIAHHKQNIPIVATFHSKYRQDFERALKMDAVVDVVIANIVRFYSKVDQVWIPQASVEPVLREYGYTGHVEVVENGNDFATPVEQIAQLREQMRAELGMKPGEMLLLYVGQHIWEKNIRLSLDALAQIKHLPYRLVMIGTGYAVDGIRQHIREIGIEDKVEMKGIIGDRELLRKYYAAADLFLFPSGYDTQGIVVREAAAMHTPSVMLSGSTAATALTDGVNGFLTPNDPLLYARIIEHLMEQPELLQKVGDQAAKTLARSWEDVVEEVRLRYKDIINEHARKKA